MRVSVRPSEPNVSVSGDQGLLTGLRIEDQNERVADDRTSAKSRTVQYLSGKTKILDEGPHRVITSFLRRR